MSEKPELEICANCESVCTGNFADTDGNIFCCLVCKRVFEDNKIKKIIAGFEKNE